MKDLSIFNQRRNAILTLYTFWFQCSFSQICWNSRLQARASFTCRIKNGSGGGNNNTIRYCLPFSECCVKRAEIMKRDAGSRKIERMNSSTLNPEYSYNINGKTNDATEKTSTHNDHSMAKDVSEKWTEQSTTIKNEKNMLFLRGAILFSRFVLIENLLMSQTLTSDHVCLCVYIDSISLYSLENAGNYMVFCLFLQFLTTWTTIVCSHLFLPGITMMWQIRTTME